MNTKTHPDVRDTAANMLAKIDRDLKNDQSFFPSEMSSDELRARYYCRNEFAYRFDLPEISVGSL